jgi:tetratricopeptide (TPR) repeat protein
MHRASMCLSLALVLTSNALASNALASAQQPVVDSEVARGIREVEEGELDAAIFTLDTAARRLATDPQRGRELGQAYLYLGIAYLGKGQEMMARARFRDAVRQTRELTLSPDQFPPKVVELVEAAKKEIAANAATAAGETAQQARVAEKKGGSKLPLILLGGAAVVGGAAVAAKGGGADPAPAAPSVERFTGTLSPLSAATASASFRINVTNSGNVDATLTWVESGPSARIKLGNADASALIAQSTAAAPMQARLIGFVTPGNYLLLVEYEGTTRSTLTFTLTVRLP